jgi:hypothetical protein
VVMAAVMHVMMAAATVAHHHVLLVSLATGLAVHHSGIHLIRCCVGDGVVMF